MHHYNSCYPEQEESCPIQESRWKILEGYICTEGHTLYITGTRVAIGFYMYMSGLYILHVNGLQIFCQVRIVAETVQEVDCPIQCQPIRELVMTSILYNNTRILYVCASVCLSTLRYPEREVVLPCCLHHLEELCLTSCTNCFSSLHDARFERKAFERFSLVTHPIPCTHRYTSGYPA